MKRGDYGSLAFLVIAIFLLALFTVIAYKVHSEVQPVFEQFNNTNATAVFEKAEVTFDVFDGGFFFAFFGLAFAVIISGFSIRSHPIFFVFSIIGLTIVALLGVIFSNTYYTFATQEGISVYANNFPLMAWIMSNLVWLLVVIGFAAAILMYSKPGVGQIEGI